MAVRKIKGSWWIDFRASQTRYRIRSPENTRSGALTFEAVLRQKLARGERIGNRPHDTDEIRTFEQFAQQWFEQYVVANNKFSEQYAKQKILAASLIPFFGSMELDAIKGSHVEQYKANEVASGVSNKTINNRLAVLAKCLRCAHEWFGTDVPIIKKLKCTPPRTDYLTSVESERLLSHTQGQIREMVFLALRTGMRQGEIRGLQWSSIDWQNRIVTVRHSRCDRNRSLSSPKSYRERHIPLDTDVYEMLFRRQQNTGYVFTNANQGGEPFMAHHAMEKLRKACRSMPMRNVTWHMLRHTFATQLSLRGVPLPVVKELLGHSTITTTMRYSHVAPVALRSAIDLLNARNSVISDFGQPVGNQWQEIGAPNMGAGL